MNKISKSLLGKKLDPSRVEKMKGRKLSESTKEKIGNSLRGKKYNVSRAGKNSPSYKEISLDMIASIKQMRQNKISLRKIASEYNISTSLVYRILNN